MKIPQADGWNLVGVYPDHDPDDVGSWLLTNGGDALLLEVPPGLTAAGVQAALARTKTRLRYITASHDHEDHLDASAWSEILRAFPRAKAIHPEVVGSAGIFCLDGEPVWLIKAPKHSLTDVVTVFRGVAMTGDIELGHLESVNREVPLLTKRRSMRWLREFPERAGYNVHTVFSAHLNDLRTNVDWPALFAA